MREEAKTIDIQGFKPFPSTVARLSSFNHEKKL
jgi:hypothetical protein